MPVLDGLDHQLPCRPSAIAAVVSSPPTCRCRPATIRSNIPRIYPFLSARPPPNSPWKGDAVMLLDALLLSFSCLPSAPLHSFLPNQSTPSRRVVPQSFLASAPLYLVASCSASDAKRPRELPPKPFLAPLSSGLPIVLD